MNILSILIPTIPERDEMFWTLYDKVLNQVDYMEEFHHDLGMIEVLYDDGPRYLEGGPSIGKKRESLVKQATGKYLCFLDDDEDIAPNYVETLVRLCQEDKDVCTFLNLTRLDNYWMIVNMSLQHPENEQASPTIIKRKPWHICPVRSEFAKKYDFQDISYGEDWTWMERVLQHCQTEAHSEAVIHQYNHSSKTSEADKIVKHEEL